MQKKGQSLATFAVGLAVAAIIVLSVAYPLIKNVITNASITGTDLLIVGSVPTLLITMLVVRVASAM